MFTESFVCTAVECGVVIKTLQSGDETGAVDQSGESILLFL